MRDEWIAVARGLKLLHVSIKAVGYGLLLLLCGTFGMCCLLIGGGTTPKFDAMLPVVPAAIAAIISFICSRIGRFHLLKVPDEVPKARFYAFATFALELVWQASLGGYFGSLLFGIEIPWPVQIAWLSLTFIFAMGSVGFTLGLMRSLADYLGHDATEVTVIAIRGQLIWMLLAIIVAVALSELSFGLMSLFSGLAGILAVILLVVSMVMYTWVLRSISHASLRKAVRCERDDDGI